MDTASRLTAWTGTPPPLFSGYTWGDVFWLVLVVCLLVGGTLAFWHQKRLATEKDLAILRAMSLPAYRQMLPRFQLELERARRFERPLSILVVRLDREQSESVGLRLRREDRRDREKRILETCGNRIMFAHVGLILQEYLRDMDLTSCDAAGERYVVALPECTGEEAAGLVGRLESLVRRGTGLAVQAGVAELGSDGLVIADVVGKATERCDGECTPEMATNPFTGTVGESRMSA